MPILADFTGVAIATLFATKTEIKEDLLRHQILNNLRSYNLKFRREYGEMILACDGGSWRKGVFPQYKAKRREKQATSTVDWTEVFRIMNLVLDEIKTNVPWKVVKVTGAEADDVIAVLAQMNPREPSVVVSNDHDFIQLTTNPKIRQYSPLKKAFVKEKDPERYALEQIIRGCKGDGVPNIFSPPDSFVAGTRQGSVNAKKLEEWLDRGEKLRFEDAMVQARFEQNRQLISFAEIPADIKQQVLNTYHATQVHSNLLSYLMKHRCSNLIECISDFQNTNAPIPTRDSLESFFG